MDINTMSHEVAKFFQEANTLQWKKNADYHPDKVAFLEILRTAYDCQITVEQDLWAKIRKQYVALKGFIINGSVESEPPRSRMIDIAVYMGMLAFWVENKDRIILDAAKFVLDYCRCEHATGKMERTCAEQNMKNEDLCDRCSFLHWLNGRAH